MAYNKTDWVNGVTKVDQGNLNNNEDGTEFAFNAVANTFSADINAYFGNTKLGDDFQDDSVWTLQSTGIKSSDLTNVKIGNQSVKLLENDNISTTLIIVKNNISIDFNSLNNGQSSSEDDYIYFVHFVSNASLIAEIRIYFGADTIMDIANAKRIIFSNFVTGWNFFKFKKSDFITLGTGNWDNIQSIRLQAASLINAQNEFVSFQLIQLVKKDPLSLIPNPFQRFGTRDFAINSGEWFVGKEFGKNIWRDLEGVISSPSALIGNKLFSSFIMSYKLVDSNLNGFVSGGSWISDGSNFITFTIQNNKIQLNINAGSSNIIERDMTIVISDNVEFILNKSESNISLTVYKNDDYSNAIIISESTSFTTQQGNVGVFITSGVQSELLSASITEISHAHHSDISETTRDSRIIDLIQSHTNIEWLGGTW